MTERCENLQIYHAVYTHLVRLAGIKCSTSSNGNMRNRNLESPQPKVESLRKALRPNDLKIMIASIPQF